MTKTYLMNSLIEKMQSTDQDFRFMGLNDLMLEIKQDPNSFFGDETTENKVLRQVLKLVEDPISEVKNQAVKCLGQLIKIIRENQMELVVDSLINYSVGKDEELRDISGLALKTITSELPPDGKIAGKACAKLTPKLLGQVSNPDTPPETLLETLSTLSILITRFPAHFADPSLTPQPLTAIAPLLMHSRPAVRKRAIATLSQFVPVAPADLFSDLLQRSILPFLAQNANLEQQRTTVNLVAAVFRQSPQHLTPSLGDIVPGILQAIQRDDDELREGCLQALETLLLRSPGEATSFLNSIVQVGVQYIKYDPNYAGGDDDEDEEMPDAGDEDDEYEDLDEYSDDEDTSYKIRRSSTKLLSAVIVTRPELLVSLYKDVSPVLISRFGDREETVRLEIWATYAALLNQTSMYGGLSQATDGDTAVRGKRKRDSEERMDVEETPYTLLRSQVPALSKSLLNQLKSPKTLPTTVQAGFQLLHALLAVLPGSLSTQMGPIAATSKSILSQPPTTTTSTLHLTCLAFLALFFSTHAPAVFIPSLPTLTPVLLKSLGERHPRIASDAFRVFSSLLNVMRPLKNNDWAGRVYDEALQRLTTHDTDAEVRACAEDCVADLWISGPDMMRMKGGKEWQAICRTTGNTAGAVKVVTKVARDVEISDQWVNSCLEWIMVLLKKSGRGGKPELFTALDTLLNRYRSGIPADLPLSLVPQIKLYVGTSDISLLSQALSILALLLELSPSISFPEIEKELLSDIYQIAHSPLVSGAALDSFLAFFSALVQADRQIATHVVPNLVIAVEKSSKTEANPSNVAKCIGQVVRSSQGVAAGTIAEYSKAVKRTSKAKTSTVVLSLLIMGELGRFIDMSPQHDVFDNAIEHFSAEEEGVRTAAAFAAGNIAIGNLHLFLPAILKVAEHDPSKRLLSLHALKEVVTHCSHGQLEPVADLIWTPLFHNSTSDSEESTRNVAAACLGKLTTTQPSRYLPQLHACIHDENPAVRATVVSAVRYTFAESSPSYDELLAPLIMDFLGLMKDTDLTVRRLALSALNSAARTKPHVVRDHLPTLLPILYAETKVNAELIRTVQMGPWTHKVDDGLDARKTAWETLYTLLDTCLPKLDLPMYLTHLLPALSDPSDEIKVLSHLLISRLSSLSLCIPLLIAHLDELTPALEMTMQGAPVTKDTVKQDLERAAELRRSTMRAVAALTKVLALGSAAGASSTGGAQKFEVFVDEVKRNEQWGAEFREVVGQ
ncbi:TIP120-domain-containing protein [Gyrodon lividus]|nr:TIP120-domain-containing protein [Gyrodon lividus]